MYRTSNAHSVPKLRPKDKMNTSNYIAGMSKEEFDQTIHDVLNTVFQPQQAFYVLMQAAMTQVLYLAFQKASDEVQTLLTKLKGELNQ